jgi:formylglycine-generating enzyme required for sulfatase activity
MKALFRGFLIAAPLLVTAVGMIDLEAFQASGVKGASKAPATKSSAATKTPAAAKAKASPPKFGDSKINPKDGNRYLYIPPGKFTEGCSPGDEDCYDDEFPIRHITLTKGFWLAETEVTQASWVKVTHLRNPSYFKGPDLPVEEMTWDNADLYCKAIGGRLPNAAEWEYAARAGTTGKRYGDLDEVAWHFGNSDLVTHPVRQKKPNAFGLYDMLGNVVEWTYTWYTVQISQEDIDPQGPKDAEFKELRGGGFFDLPELVRASYRSRIEPEHTDRNIGMRCVSNF